SNQRGKACPRRSSRTDEALPRSCTPRSSAAAGQNQSGFSTEARWKSGSVSKPQRFIAAASRLRARCSADGCPTASAAEPKSDLPRIASGRCSGRLLPGAVAGQHQAHARALADDLVALIQRHVLEGDDARVVALLREAAVQDLGAHVDRVAVE